ncbi:MAG: hypothetical protein ABIR38_05095 [Chthoniobacterales bacterium]
MKSFRLAALFSLLFVHSLIAGSATWSANPANSDWSTAANWMPNTVPNGRGEVANFATSAQTAVSLSTYVKVDEVHFATTSSPFTITAEANTQLTFTGAGIVNDSGETQHFVNAAAEGAIGCINFAASASAGENVSFLCQGGMKTFVLGGCMFFTEASDAGTASFTVNGGVADGARGAYLDFSDTASAAAGTFVVNGSMPDAIGGGFINFLDTATAANATVEINGAPTPGSGQAFLQFFEESTLGEATIVVNGGLTPGAEGGLVKMWGQSTGPGARVELHGNGPLTCRPTTIARSTWVVLMERVSSHSGEPTSLLVAATLTVSSRE